MPSTPEPGPLLDTLPPTLPVETILQPPPAEPLIVETYRPLGSCLDWELGQLFYQRRGTSAFLNGEVPYLVNNDGVLAARAAALFFTSVEERASGPAPPELSVLEFGGGSCLFARGFLLAFKRISEANGRDYHQRLTYVLADHSEPMLQDAQRYGVFPAQSRVLLARAEAVEPQFEWLDTAATGPVRFDAIFLNYLLDCLPATVLRSNGDSLEQLCVQTELSSKSSLPGGLKNGRERIEAFASGKSRDRSELIDLYPLFRLRCRFHSVPEQDLLFFHTIAPLLNENKPVLHSYAAVACLETCFQMLRENGFVLFSDYIASNSDSASPREHVTRALHQHFGSSTAIGLNYEQLKDYVVRVCGAIWVEPPADDESLVVRLAGRGIGDRTTAHLRQLFDRGELERLRAPRRQARDHRSAGAHQLALDCYRQAILMQPENWNLIAETALFCETVLHNHQMGLDLARAGLELNPIDPDLWNTLGDSLFSLGRKEEAQQAFHWALQLSPSNVRARYNLVYALSREGNLKGALAMIAEALAADIAGEYTDRLLKRQNEILNEQKRQRRHLSEQIADRYCWE